MAERIALGIEYDGRGYCGWQTQPGGCAIQNHLEAALARIHGAPVQTVVAGRTDAGVHALTQVVHFDIEHERPEQAWVRGVNTHLPEGVSVLWARRVPVEFDARRSALERTYRYLLLNRAVRPALMAGRVGWIFGELDVVAMAEAGKLLEGTHDFTSFRAAECQANTPIRTMHRVALSRSGEFVTFEFRANAFLHHQIRNMVGALLWVGLGRRPQAWIGELLACKDRSKGAATFAPDGLYLASVRYDAKFGLPSVQLDLDHAIPLNP